MTESAQGGSELLPKSDRAPRRRRIRGPRADPSASAAEPVAPDISDLLRVCWELAGLAMVSTDSNRRCLQANDAAAAIFALKKENMTGRSLSDWVREIGPSAQPVPSGITTGTWLLQRREAQAMSIDYRMKELADGTCCFVFGDNRVGEASSLSPQMQTENPHPVVRISRDGTLLSANSSASRSFSDLHLDVGKVAPEPLLNVARGISAHDIPDHEVRIGSRTFLINGHASPGGGCVHLYAVDISQQKAAETALETSEARHHLLTEQAIDGVVVADGETLVFQDANAAALRMLGCTREELCHLKAMDFVPPDQLPRLAEELRHLQGGLPLLTEWEIIRRDGSVLPVEVGATLLPDGRVHGLLRDMTERRLMQQKNSETEARLRTALNSLIEGCQIIAFDWTYLFVNSAAARHGRKTKDELLGHKLTDVYPGIDTTPVFATLRKAMESRTPCELENEFSYEDGASALFQLVLQPVPEGLFILSHDITERRRLEEQILSIQDKEQHRIGSDLHDDVGQQLTAISLLNNLLLHDLDAQKLPMAAQAAKIAGLVTHVMTAIRRISHGLQPVIAEPGGLMTALQELVRNTSSVSTRLECPEPVLLRDHSCANHLYRIAQEALQNALRHAQASCVTIRLFQGRRNVVLEVEDDGVGFAGARPRKGIGLQTLKYRSRAVRGALKFIQTEAGGTLVRCTMPVDDAQPRFEFAGSDSPYQI